MTHRICFATPRVRPLLEPSFHDDFGGAEVRALTFAQELSRRPDVRVCLQLNSLRRERSRSYGNLDACFLRQPAPIPKSRDLPHDATLPWSLTKVFVAKTLRSLQKRWKVASEPKLPVIRTLAKVPADVFCTFGVHHYSAKVIATAKRYGRRSALFLASDTDLDGVFAQGRTDVEDDCHRVFRCHYALQHADRIIAQTEYQKHQLARGFGRESVVIRNPIDLTLSPLGPSPIKKRYVLWIGRADSYSKRADKCLDLAKLCPTVNFLLILNRRNPEDYARMTSNVPNNVDVIERVPYHDIDRYFQHAVAFLNTSDAEGFPNTFLQAGKYSVPIASLTVDPGEMISRHGCGTCASGNLRKLSEQLMMFWHRADYRAAAARRIHTYVRTYHDQRERTDELHAVLRDICQSVVTDRKAA